MIVVKGVVNGKSYWTSVKTMDEAKNLMSELYSMYKTVRVWLEDMAGKIVMTFEKMVDRVRLAVPKRRMFWWVLGAVLGI